MLHILPVIAAVALIAFAGGNVYQAQVKKREATRLAAEAEQLKKQAALTIKEKEKVEDTKVEVPPAAETEKPIAQPAPAPKPTTATTKPAAPTKTYTYVGISSVTSTIDGDNVILTAALPAAYSGVCTAKVKLASDYSKYEYKEASFSGSNTCSVTFSKASLGALGSNFKAFVSWRNNDYTVKGDHGGYDFSL